VIAGVLRSRGFGGVKTESHGNQECRRSRDGCEPRHRPCSGGGASRAR